MRLDSHGGGGEDLQKRGRSFRRNGRCIQKREKKKTKQKKKKKIKKQSRRYEEEEETENPEN